MASATLTAPASARLSWLDGMKGISILWIAFFHFFGTYANGGIHVKPFEILRVEGSREHFASQISALVSDSFLIRKSDNLDSERQFSFAIAQMLDTRDGHQHTEGSVKFSGITHGIQM